MNDGELLRRAVYETPWDDSLRLVNAGRLMEYGDAHQTHEPNSSPSDSTNGPEPSVVPLDLELPGRI